MPRLRLSRLLPASLLLVAIFLALRENVFVSAFFKLISPVQHVQHATQPVFTSENSPQYSRRIVAVGDLHGDYGNALQVLQMAGVVDKAGNWSGKVDLFVQTGDIIDRWVP